MDCFSHLKYYQLGILLSFFYKRKKELTEILKIVKRKSTADVPLFTELPAGEFCFAGSFAIFSNCGPILLAL